MSARRATRGFTLLEVLAAAMIFAMVVTVLIGSSSETVHRAGLSARRLEASQLADRELALLESILYGQRTPPEDKEEERDDFVVRVFSVPALEDLGGGASPGDAPPSSDSLLALATGGGGAAGLGAMLTLQAPGIDQFLLRYEIVVEWIEGAQPDRVSRTTYAFDWEGARAALPDLFAAGAALEDGIEGAEGLPEGAADLIRQLPGGVGP